ncbi:cell filamentation protein Fic [Pelistega indica]|uniref:Cell filamentation protein Fic n=1 Tax=Pelistega indica TaxID=1414851 RepID=V8FV78_9BURK|nr:MULTISPECIES: Fic family protein [Pelistega]ETD67608.1 cell filamentation protein Fic [Pelistega indica]
MVKTLDPVWAIEHPSLLKDLRLRYIYHTNAIEGNSLSLIETKIIISDGITVGGKKLSEHLEAINQAQALQFLENAVKQHEPLSQYFIRELHYYVLNHDEENRGVYRTSSVFIEGSETTTALPSMIPSRLDGILKDFGKNKETLGLIPAVARFHADFEEIHPFVDGNGRTGRLLMNLELLKGGYPITIIEKDDRPEYYRTLEIAQTGNRNIEPLTRFIEYSINKTISFIEKRIDSYLSQQQEPPEPELEM